MLRAAHGKDKRIDGIIFDLDGTLIDLRIDIINSVNFTLQKLGLPRRSPEYIASYIGLGRDFKEDIIKAGPDYIIDSILELKRIIL